METPRLIAIGRSQEVIKNHKKAIYHCEHKYNLSFTDGVSYWNRWERFTIPIEITDDCKKKPLISNKQTLSFHVVDLKNNVYKIFLPPLVGGTVLVEEVLGKSASIVTVCSVIEVFEFLWYLFSRICNDKDNELNTTRNKLISKQ